MEKVVVASPTIAAWRMFTVFIHHGQGTNLRMPTYISYGLKVLNEVYYFQSTVYEYFSFE